MKSYDRTYIFTDSILGYYLDLIRLTQYEFTCWVINYLVIVVDHSSITNEDVQVDLSSKTYIYDNS